MKRMLMLVMLLAALFDLGLTSDANAIIGRPLTPLSFAGVARRTTRRAVYAGAVAAPVYAAPVAPVYAAPPAAAYW